MFSFLQTSFEDCTCHWCCTAVLTSGLDIELHIWNTYAHLPLVFAHQIFSHYDVYNFQMTAILVFCR